MGVFGGNVHEGMPLAEVNFSNRGGGQAGLALNGADDLVAGDAIFGSNAHVQAGLSLGSFAAGFWRLE